MNHQIGKSWTSTNQNEASSRYHGSQIVEALMSDPIKHVVLLMLENHSFDQMLGCFKTRYPELEGVDPTNLGRNTDGDGKVYFQSETTDFQMELDPQHEQKNVLDQLRDNNGGFVRDFSAKYPSSSGADRQQIMGYYPMGTLPALHVLANEFAICDHWFSSLPGPTWPNRFFALSGTANGEVEMPSGNQQVDPRWYLRQTQHTVFDRLNEAHRKWKVYYYDFPNSWLLLRQLYPANVRNYHKISEFFDVDCLDEKTFPDFVFIEPKYFGKDQNDDHPPHNVIKAEKLIADVYNALRSNEELWQTTLLIVTFDEHGGFFDHVAPPAAVPPDARTQNFRFDHFGVRVPAVLVSPWVGRRVEHTTFDHTSVLKYVTRKWSLGPLGARVASAQTNDIGVAITETEPRRDAPPFIRVAYTDLMPQKPALEEEDVSSHQNAIHGFASFLEQQTLEPAFAEAAVGPSWWASVKKGIGKVLIGGGNALANEFHELERQKVDRVTNLVKAGATGAVRFKVPLPEDAAGD
jgi:phospholipase C